VPKRATAPFPTTLAFDRKSATPLQRQIFEQIRSAILGGTLRAGTRLPSTRDLAREIGVSRKPVVAAFGYLAAQGLIECRPGAGSRVRPLALTRQRVPASTRARRPKRAARLQRIVVHISSGRVGAFKPGVPAVDLFPTRVWRTLVARRWSAAQPADLAYDDSRIRAALSSAIAAHLGATRGIRCDPAQVFVVSGAQQAIDLAARVLVEPDDRVCVEDPGYAGARAAFASAGAEVVGGGVDAEGFDVNAAASRCPRPRLIYATPAHQYPTGIVMSVARRNELLSWTAASGAWLIEDDYGGEFQYRANAPPPLFATDRNESVIYIGTFSQSLAPALRVGFLVAPADLIEAFRVAVYVCGHGISAIDAQVLTDFIDGSHLAKHIRLLRSAYRERQRELVAALARIPGIVRIDGLDAGTHIVAYLRADADEFAIAAAAARHGVEVSTLNAHAFETSCPPALVLGYGSVPPESIRSSAALLARAISE